MYQLSPSELRGLNGVRRLGPGPWHVVGQDRIDLFAEATGDDMWIHVDQERALASPFGHTIAHGYLTLSLLPLLQRELWRYSGFSMSLNYGLGRVRFPTPVAASSRVRLASAELTAMERSDGSWLLTVESTIGLEDTERPACVAQSLVLLQL